MLTQNPYVHTSAFQYTQYIPYSLYPIFILSIKPFISPNNLFYAVLRENFMKYTKKSM